MKFSRSFSLFKGVKREPNTFSYRTRFYDEEKEEKAKRRKAVEQELKREDRGERRISFSRADQDNWIKQSYRKQAFNSNIIIFVVLIILCFLAFAALKYLDTVHV
ncbi:MAG: hypothetical protein AB8B53_03285 [Flavobacteriales bacterium]